MAALRPRGVRTEGPAEGWLLLAFGLGALVLGACGAEAVAKPGDWVAAVGADDPKTDPEAAADRNVFPVADRGLLLLLSKARQLVQQERFAEAVQCLGAILDAPEDAFFRSGEKTDLYPGLKAEAQAMLGRLPRQGRELYELQYGARARQMLTAAAAAGDAAGLAEVSRRYFHTRAGYEATLLLGLYHWNHGSPLAGALTLKRLKDSAPMAEEFEPGLSLALAACWLRSGAAEKSQALLDELKARFPLVSVKIGGNEVPIAGTAAKLLGAGGQSPGAGRALEGWLMPRGNPARNAPTAASAPLLSVGWRVPTAEHPYVESLLGLIQQANREQDRWALPAAQPLVVEDLVLMRTARNLLAVDFTTGKRVWEVPGDDPFESLADSPSFPGSSDGAAFGYPAGVAFDLQSSLRFRLWGDATFGTLTSDGQRVYAVEDLSLDLGAASARAMFMPSRRPLPTDPRPYNRLAAYEVRSGKLVWHLGGSPEELGLPQAGTFFLGPPLPVGSQLFVIAEQKGDIRLLTLEAKTGSVAWTQQLGAVDQDRDILQDPLRRVSGVSPSYADGVLVCPTSNKSVVAMEPAARSLLWGYVYQRGEPAQARNAPVFFGMTNPSDPEPATRWAQTTAILAEGRVVAAPVDSAEVHCLSLIDGKLLWRQPRQEDLYVACVHQGKVVLVGARAMRALKLSDGTPAWEAKSLSFPPGALASGTGFLSGDRYYVPLSTGEVAAVDVVAGRIAHAHPSRRGVVPGNLVCAGGRVISQRADAVEQFFQLDALRQQVDERLSARPEDPEALAQRGEILWDEGKLSEAIACFRRAGELAPGPNVRALLRDALFAGLRSDFARYRDAGEEIRRLIDEPRQLATYDRLMAEGFEQAKQHRSAWQHYLKLMDLDRQGREMETVDRSHSIRRDRWIQVRLAALREGAPPAVRAEMDREAQSRLDAAAKEGSPDGLQRFLDYFGAQPASERARQLLVARLREGRRWLPAELVLRSMARPADRQAQGAAWAELAAMLREAKAVSDAAACYARLGREFRDVVCREGKTGGQLLEGLPADDPVRALVKTPASWPTGQIVVERKPQAKTPPMAYYSAIVPYQDTRGPFFSDVTVQLHQNPPKLSAVDGWGRERWSMGVSDLMRQESFPMSSAFLRATVRDHLLLLSIGFKIVALDTLAGADGGQPKVLWVADLEEPGRAAVRRVRGRGAAFPGQRMAGLSPFGAAQFPANIPAFLSPQLVCYQRFQNLHGVDPVSGETLWVREDLRPDSTVFGDDQYVFVLPPEQSVATVLRAGDGTLVGTRPVPAVRPATLGRLVVGWRPEAEHAVLELVDPLQDRRLWQLQFSRDAKIYPLEHEAVGIFEPAGKFVLVDLADGRKIIEAELGPQEGMSDLQVLRSPGQTLVVVNGADRRNRAGRQYYGLQGVPSVHVGRAKIYAFDAQGKPLWKEPVVVQNQYLVLSQPPHLPALIFACGIQERRLTTMGSPKVSILAVDKRTGQVVQPKETFEGLSHFRLAGDPEKKAIEIHLQREVVTLRFTDQPWEPPAAKAKEKSPPTPTSALMKALRRAAERGLNLPLEEEEEAGEDR